MGESGCPSLPVSENVDNFWNTWYFNRIYILCLATGMYNGKADGGQWKCS